MRSHPGTRAWALVAILAGLSLSRTASGQGVAPAPRVGSSLVDATRSLTRDEYRLAFDNGGVTAPNRAQGLRTRWQEGTVHVTPRADASAWSFSYQLIAVERGFDATTPRLTPLPVESEAVSECRLEWLRPDGVREWYSNDEHGVEQGFVLERRPPGDPALPVVVVGAIGGLMAVPGESGLSVRLRTHAGVDALEVSHLLVTDAADPSTHGSTLAQHRSSS